MLESLKRLFGKGETARTFADRIHGPGTFDVELVIGESPGAHNVELIWQATSNRFESKRTPEGDDYWEKTAEARLVSESGTANDRHPIGVEIAGKKVGKLNRADALRVHRRLQQIGFDRIDSSCDSLITGRPKYWKVKVDIAEKSIVPSEGEN